MQKKKEYRSNQERSDKTRDALLSAARTLFANKGYAETSTPEIAAAATITRGALYHHFKDKRELFRAVLEREAHAVADEIEAVTPSGLPARQALIAGSEAYLDAMTVPGRTRLLLIEGPVVLGRAEMIALDEANAARTLYEGLEAAMTDSGRMDFRPSVLAILLSAAFDRAAEAIENGADPAEFKSAMAGIIERVLRS
ncbi:MAG: TetR/AcrR family transcriptional regulator [Alphaproteobacteria bacterium]|nr:TetR/AcrR family transcriptional regulator [Alphaproteobacteria bacterium]